MQNSTKRLVLGITLTPVGLFMLRQAEKLLAVDDPTVFSGEYPDGYIVLVTLGFLALVAGAGFLISGVIRLSRNVELAARAAAVQLEERERGQTVASTEG